MTQEIVIVCGYNAAGKSTTVQAFLAEGYTRINRDEMGGTIEGQTAHAIRAMKNGAHTVVLDNTYPTIESRKSIIAAGKSLGVPVRCCWITTSFEDAQFNACMRMMQWCGRILGPEEFKTTKDPNIFPPAALFKYKKEFQKPTTKEGFVWVEELPFVRIWDKEFRNKALLLDYDGTLRESTGAHPWPEHPDEVKILPNRAKVLAEWQAKGYKLLGASTQSACAKELSIETAKACFERTNNLLSAELDGFKRLDIDYLFCPHANPPKTFCYCRKPAVGMLVQHIVKHNLLPSECIVVGDQTSDKTFATRGGCKFVHAEEFFSSK